MSAASDRDPFFDNAKFLLVVLVALGHSWDQIAGTDALRALHTVVYGFHMPAFVLLSGYFSRSFSFRPGQVRRLTSGVLAPYLIFETIYCAVYAEVRGTPFSITPTAPLYLLWFLIALFVWRLTAPMWKAVRFPVAVAVVISLAAGMTKMSYDLALPRVLMFLPWFVLGLRMRPEHFALLRTRTARVCALPAILVALAVAYVLAPGPDDNWLSMFVGYGELGVSPGTYLAVRLVLFAVSAVLVAAFFALVPHRRTFFTTLGAVTLYPYLLHGLLIRLGEGAGAFPPLQAHGLPGEALLSLCAITAVFLLSTPPVRRLTRPLVEPRFPRWLIPKDSGQKAPAEQASTDERKPEGSETGLAVSGAMAQRR
ncbi:hypothetical protein EOT10_18520 [Streptomyces antnestii]|uniref:Acyltransferase 3 domain-containing protein n=1 Tax=Streptomyces antnestii TaxID=2494256 RepID=A0A437PL85_9ACTN|nr:acyltransferase family protein [Streptomyces sp. San01]RVU23061.1 hypothetical protein EOT10_18520 [Streptomyces sp. San01]